MIKVLIWGTGACGQEICSSKLSDKADVVAFVESEKSKDECLGIKVIDGKSVNKYVYDLLIIATAYFKDVEKNILKWGIDITKCVFTLDANEYECRSKGALDLLVQCIKENFCANGLTLNFCVGGGRQKKYDIVETQENLLYMGSYNDDLLCEMRKTGRTYSSDEIDAFFELVDKFYTIDNTGYFLDCGCNILTTSIYALNRNDKLHAVAFEPVKKTYNFAVRNAGLNLMSDRISIINVGLSNTISNGMIHCYENSCGGNYIVNDTANDNECEKIELTTLDEWSKQNSEVVNKIAYMWIDVEGYEGFVIDGAKQLLTKKRLPIYMEFYASFLKRAGCYELLIKNLEKLYSKYIIVRREGKYNINEVLEIKSLWDQKDLNENIFLIP